MKWTPFQRECDHKYATLLSTELMGSEQEDKNSRFWNGYIVYLVLHTPYSQMADTREKTGA